jgi:TonB family protein
MTRPRCAAVASVALHTGMTLLVLAAPAPVRRGPTRSSIALELDVRPRAEPVPVPVPARVEPQQRPVRPRRVVAAASVLPEPAPSPVPPSPPAEPALPAPAPAPAPSPTPRPPEDGPPRPLALFDRAALAAAVEVEAPRGSTGTTTRGEADEGAGGAAAVDGVRAITEELREQAQAGRPEAAGVVTYFGDARRRMAGAWAPRTLHLPSRTKAMIQSMQAVNRAALEMMEGRTRRSRRAQEDGRITPDEWRDAMRDAALRARAVTSAIVAVVHDEEGRVVDVRVTRSSGHAEFDREVLAAARETLSTEPPPIMPGDEVAATPAGRVARYRFDVLMTAMPPVPPVAGVTFDESTGYFRVFYPGEINWRLNVVFLGARRGMELRPQSHEAVD